jgi:hypothetical protein
LQSEVFSSLILSSSHNQEEASKMVSSIRFIDMPEQEQQQKEGEEEQYRSISSNSKQCSLKDVVEIMAVVRDDQQSSSLVHSPKARRASYARQRSARYASQLAAVDIENPLRSPTRKRIVPVIPRSRNELDQVHHSKVTSDIHILDVVHHNRRSSTGILSLKELKHQANDAPAEYPDFYSS